jgi:integrase
MPRLSNRNPSYRRHRASGQAVVTLSGQDIYLGPHGSAASRQEYDRVMGEYLARGRQLAATPATSRVSDIIAAYWQFAAGYYGTPVRRSRLSSIKVALGVLRRTYGNMPAVNFGPLALQNVRAAMIGQEWSRPYVNDQIGRIKRCFKWAARRELVPAAVIHGLSTIEGLRKGESAARETDPVKPVPEKWVEATIAHVSRQVAGLIRLQLASGMRPGEAVIMRGGDLDTSGKVWLYIPERHKTQHHGHERPIFLGPQAQDVIRPFLKTDLSAYLFSPLDAERGRREALTASRTTPLSCGNVPGSNRVRKPKKGPATRYTVDSYRRAITTGCDRAFPPPADVARQRVKGEKGMRWETAGEWGQRLGKEKWSEVKAWREDHHWHPNQLRHNAGTRIRKHYGLEAARVVLGQKSAAVAEIYAEIDQTKAMQIMGEVG